MWAWIGKGSLAAATNARTESPRSRALREGVHEPALPMRRHRYVAYGFRRTLLRLLRHLDRLGERDDRGLKGSYGSDKAATQSRPDPGGPCASRSPPAALHAGEALSRRPADRLQAPRRGVGGPRDPRGLRRIRAIGCELAGVR